MVDPEIKKAKLFAIKCVSFQFTLIMQNALMWPEKFKKK